MALPFIDIEANIWSDLSTSAIYLSFLSVWIFMVPKCYLDSEDESGNLDLPFFIEFNLTRDFPIRYVACIRNLSSHISIKVELLGGKKCEIGDTSKSEQI